MRYSNLPPGGVIEGWRSHRRFRRCHRRCDGVIEGFDGAIEGATVSYRRCHRRCDGAWRFRRCHRSFDGACRFRRCHRRCGGVIEGFDGAIEASSVRVPPQVRAGSRNVRTDLARRFATATPIDKSLGFCFQLWSCPGVLFLLWRFHLSSAWCFAFAVLIS